MKKKLLASLLLLTGLGIALTLYLPPMSPATTPGYEVDQKSLKKPLAADDLMLRVAPEKDSQYGLQLGLYPSLSQATTEAEKMAQSDTIQVVAANYDKQPWYVLLLGPFSTQAEALDVQQGLNNQEPIASALVRWPKPLAGKQATSGSKSSP